MLVGRYTIKLHHWLQANQAPRVRGLKFCGEGALAHDSILKSSLAYRKRGRADAFHETLMRLESSYVRGPK